MNNCVVVKFVDGELAEMTAFGKFPEQGVEIDPSITLICEHPMIETEGGWKKDCESWFVGYKRCKEEGAPFGHGHTPKIAFLNFLNSAWRKLEDPEHVANKHFSRLTHTVEDDFQHFLSYSQHSKDSKETIALLREAFEAAWSPTEAEGD